MSQDLKLACSIADMPGFRVRMEAALCTQMWKKDAMSMTESQLNAADEVTTNLQRSERNLTDPARGPSSYSCYALRSFTFVVAALAVDLVRGVVD